MNNKEFNELIIPGEVASIVKRLVYLYCNGNYYIVNLHEITNQAYDFNVGRFLLLDFLRHHSFKKNQFIRQYLFFTNVVVDNLRRY